MKLSEFHSFRCEVVAALRTHPQWRKVRRHRYDPVPSVIPDTPGARTYWRIRNGTQNLVHKYANINEAASVCLGSAYDPEGDYRIDPADARLVKKWRQEFAALTDGES